MTSSVQTETDERDLESETNANEIHIPAIKPWTHLDVDDNHLNAKSIEITRPCNKFNKIVKSMAGFEALMNFEEDSTSSTASSSSDSVLNQG